MISREQMKVLEIGGLTVDDYYYDLSEESCVSACGGFGP